MYKVQFTTFVKGRQAVIETMTLDQAEYITTSIFDKMKNQIEQHIKQPVFWRCYKMRENE